MVTVLLLYMASGSALAFSFSNLSYKKIQTRGLYGYSSASLNYLQNHMVYVGVLSFCPRLYDRLVTLLSVMDGDLYLQGFRRREISASVPRLPSIHAKDKVSLHPWYRLTGECPFQILLPDRKKGTGTFCGGDGVRQVRECQLTTSNHHLLGGQILRGEWQSWR